MYGFQCTKLLCLTSHLKPSEKQVVQLLFVPSFTLVPLKLNSSSVVSIGDRRAFRRFRFSQLLGLAPWGGGFARSPSRLRRSSVCGVLLWALRRSLLPHLTFLWCPSPGCVSVPPGFPVTLLSLGHLRHTHSLCLLLSLCPRVAVLQDAWLPSGNE